MTAISTATAVGTAARVLAWAAEPAGPVPAGPLWDVAALARPPDSVRAAAGQLARRTAARLGAEAPPFGAPSQAGQPRLGQARAEPPRIGLGAVFLAAAAGGRQQAGAAALLAGAVPPPVPRRVPGAWYDLVARHGVVAAAVAALAGAEAGAEAGNGDGDDSDDTEPLSELLLGASPLTAVLYRPTLRALRSDTTGQAVGTAVALLSRRRGQAVLAAGLAGWAPHPQVLGWRAGLLARLRHDHPDLLLDVYLTARTRFAADWDEKISWAARHLSMPGGGPDPLAIATLRFWAPLAAMERDGPLSGRRPLLSGQDRALTLVRRFRLDQAGAA